jgi:PAS domain S-box-containing protein
MKAALQILNLEDNINDAELNAAMLAARWPHSQLIRVETRDDYVKALEEDQFDVILSDFTMPGFDGMQALALARKKAPTVPFLFVSGTIGEDTAIEALKNGATDYVLKHRLVRLIPVVDRALREAEERAECTRAEEAMRQSEYKYRQLFECLSDAAFLADEETGKIIDVNRQAEVLLGRTRAEILGHKLFEFLTLGEGRHDTNGEELESQVVTQLEWQAMPTGGPAAPVDVRATRLTLYGRPLVLRLCRQLNLADS